jgi:hypothetical protein
MTNIYIPTITIKINTKDVMKIIINYNNINYTKRTNFFNQIKLIKN